MPIINRNDAADVEERFSRIFQEGVKRSNRLSEIASR